MRNGHTQPESDRALRVMSEDGSFRLLLATTTDTAADILARQGTGEDTRGIFTDLITATVLLRLTMSPDYRLQGLMQGGGGDSMVVDSLPDGVTRGMLRKPLDKPFRLGPPTRFAVHRQLFGGGLHQGIVETSHGQSLSDVVTGYLDKSEQIASVVGLSQRFDDTRLVTAGGYLVQHLPEADEATLALLTAQLLGLPPASELFATHRDDLEAIAEAIFGPIQYRILGEDHFHSGCICGPERVFAALKTISPEDLAELAQGDEHLSVDCDYCGATHEVPVEDLLLDRD